jgi:hypothetical protein
MTEDERQRTMEFILQQQAQFAAGMQQIEEKQKLLQEKQNVLTDSLLTVVGIVGKLTVAQELTDTKLAHLAEAQANTDERLNTLIGIVERYFSNGRNDRPQA